MRKRLKDEHKPEILYMTPEKLKESDSARKALDELYESGNLARLAFDEAHCIPTWGQDFRPAVGLFIYRAWREFCAETSHSILISAASATNILVSPSWR